MVSLISSKKTQDIIKNNLRDLRLKKGLTQQGLSDRSGVSLSTLRKFEQQGIISLESFLKLSLTLGCLEKVVYATQPGETKFNSIDEVLKKKEEKKRQRGWRK